MELIQTQIDTIQKNLRNKHIKVELLNEDFKTISTIEGAIVGGEITANADNDIRYSGNLTIAIPTYVNRDNFLVELEDYTISAQGKIWLDKRVRILIGIDNYTSGEIVWYNMGIYYIDQPTRTFSGTDYLVSFNIADQMIKLSGARQGQLTGSATTFEKGYYDYLPFEIRLNEDVSNAKFHFDSTYTGSFGITDYQGTILETTGGQNINYINGVSSLANTGGFAITKMWKFAIAKPGKFFIAFNSVAYTGIESKRYAIKQDLNGNNTIIDTGYDYSWSAGTYGNGTMVAIASGSQYGIYSTDNTGTTWTQMDLGTSQAWSGVYYDYSRQRFYAYASGSQYGAYSDDGITWTSIDFEVSQAWSCMGTTGNGTLVLFIANSNTYYVSTDGATFELSDTTLPESLNWSCATNFYGSMMVFAKGSDTAYKSVNASSWISVDLGYSANWVNVTQYPEISSSGTTKYYFLVASNKILYCTASTSWTSITLPTQGAYFTSGWSYAVVSPIGGTAFWRALFLNGSYGTYGILGYDSITGSPSFGSQGYLDEPKNITSVIYDARNRYYVYGGYSTHRGNFIAHSSNLGYGISASSYVTNSNRVVKLATNGLSGSSGIDVAILNDGSIISSTDTTTWLTNPISLSSATMQDLIYANSNFVAIANYNRRLYVATTSSPSALTTWNFTAIDTSAYYDAISMAQIIYANDMYVIIMRYSGGCLIYTSTDLSTWSKTTFTDNYLFRNITYGNNTFVIVASGKNSARQCITLTSADGTTWAETILTPDYGYSSLVSVSYTNGFFILLNAYGSDNYLYYGQDGVTWAKYELPSQYSLTNEPFIVNLLNSVYIFYQSNSYITSPVISRSLYYYDGETTQQIVKINIGSTNVWYLFEIDFPSNAGRISSLDNDLMVYFRQYTTTSERLAYVQTKTEDALKSVITELAGITKYSIYPIPDKYKYLPYDIKVGVGATVLEILNKFKDILSTWQMYFDRASGYFIVEPIPNGENDIVYELDETQLIQNDQNLDFQNVKNQVVVYGKANTMTYYTDNETTLGSVSYDGDILKLNYTSVDTGKFVIGSTLFGFMTPSAYNPLLRKVMIYANGTLVCQGDLVDFEYQNAYVPENLMQPSEIYCIRIYDASLNNDGTINIYANMTFEFYSKQQALWSLVNDNTESPFYINKNLPEPNYYCGLSQSIGGVSYTLTLNNTKYITGLVDGTILTFMANLTNGANPTITVYSALDLNTPLVSNLPIKQNYFDGSTRPVLGSAKISNDYTIHKVQYDATNDEFVYLGRNEKALTQVFSGGEYDNIYADQLAYERCLYELYQHSNMEDTITLGIVPNYNLDINKKIPYNEKFTNIDTEPQSNFVVTPDSNLLTTNRKQYVVQSGTKEFYLTKTVTFPLGVSNTLQNITAIKIYKNKNLVGDDYSYITDTN